MHVDRSRFLLLTASLAAAACRPAPTPPQPGETDTKSTGGSLGGTSSESSGVWLEIEPGTEDPEVADAGSCDNTVGNPKSCTDLVAPGPHCESFVETQRICEALPRQLLARPAEAGVACLLARSGTEAICDWNSWQDCAVAAIGASCAEPRTRETCVSISAACGGGVDIFQCQQAMSSVAPASMSRVSSCIQEFCDPKFCVIDFATIF